MFYLVHKHIDDFLDKYRKGGKNQGEKPTIGEYMEVSLEALEKVGVSGATIKEARAKILEQLKENGLTLCEEIPVKLVPRRSSKK
jgi:hypothetical protein